MEPDRDNSTYYYPRDAIHNLQIRVSLQQLTGAQLVDASPRAIDGPPPSGSAVEADIPLSSLAPPQTAKSSGQGNSHQATLTWQQKLLSPCEVVKYQQPGFADHPRFKKYHEQAKKLRKPKHRNKRLFTYINEDNYQAYPPPTTSQKDEEEYVLRRRNIPEKMSDEESENEEGEEKEKIIKKHHKVQSFYVMADLATPDSIRTVYSSNDIICNDHFEKFIKHINSSYSCCTSFSRLESLGPDNALYEYTIENISVTRNLEERINEDRLTVQAAVSRIEELQILVGEEFEIPPVDGSLRVVVTGELVRSLHFNTSSKLYVHYVLHLPSGWNINPGSDVESFTPTCANIVTDTTHSAHFSTPFFIDITRTPAASSSLPVLLLGVFSVDTWSRDRDEGYAAFTLPLIDFDQHCDKGRHLVKMWRPAQTTPFSQLRRHFLGGSQLIADPTYLIVGRKQDEVSRVSRLGLQTLSTGSLELRTNVMMQTDPHQNENAMLNFSQWGTGGSSWQLSTQAVLQAFNSSRQKLRAAKHGLS
ncbi:unnamed protein product, partial [Meganyctiphanes norvegica]